MGLDRTLLVGLLVLLSAVGPARAQAPAPEPAPAPAPAPAPDPAPEGEGATETPAVPPAAEAPLKAGSLSGEVRAAEPSDGTPPPAVEVPEVGSDRSPINATPLPPRALHRVALLGELGWNGLAGLGLNGIFHAHPHLSLDFGLGIGGPGVKAGARARLNFLTSEWTPLVGAGLIYGTGSGGEAVELETDGNRVNLELEPSAFLQMVAGAEFTPREGGFSFLATLGYAHLFEENIRIVGGTPTEEQADAMKLAYHGGLVLSVALGYAF